MQQVQMLPMLTRSAPDKGDAAPIWPVYGAAGASCCFDAQRRR